jgi:hypothetical protein
LLPQRHKAIFGTRILIAVHSVLLKHSSKRRDIRRSLSALCITGSANNPGNDKRSKNRENKDDDQELDERKGAP